MVARAVFSILYYPPMRELLNPLKYGFFALQMWSHRMLRWAHGMFLVTALLSNILLMNSSSLYWWLGVGQIGAYLMALSGYMIESRTNKRAPFPLHFAYYYLSAQIAMLQGLWLGIRKARFIVWQPIR